MNRSSASFSMALSLAVSLVVLLIPPGSAKAQDMRLVRIGTGGLLGVYYPIGKALAQGLTAAALSRGLIAVAQTSGGSKANVRAMAEGDMEAGLVQADVAYWAFRGEGSFAGDDSGISVRAVASLYPERLQMVTRKDAGIRKVTDLRGKKFSLDEPGSGTLAVMRIVLEEHGLTEKDLSPVYLKPEFTMDTLAAGGLDGFSLMAGVPVQAIVDLADHDLFMVPVFPDIALSINQEHSYLVPGVIPEGIYAGIPETPTIEVHALLLVREDLSEELVYWMTKSIWDEQIQSLLREAHSEGSSVTLESALHGLSIPLHDGARRFYQEKGFSPPGEN